MGIEPKISALLNLWPFLEIEIVYK